MDVLRRLQELRERGEPVALATVVASRRPASARPGDRALVLAGGELLGWIGGSCAQPTVQREGLRALADGQPRLIRLSPEAGLLAPQEGVIEDVMTCHSGGTLEIYVEPFLPAPWLLVTGDSPIADALATLGALDDFRVLREVLGSEGVLPGGERYVVVAGMSGEDELDLERALALDPFYVAFVGSRKRLGEVIARLRERGVSAALLARVKGPAGLDIGAVTAAEIAVSIMAEIVQHRRRGSLVPGQRAADDAPATSSRLPLALARERGSGGEGRSSTPGGEGRSSAPEGEGRPSAPDGKGRSSAPDGAGGEATDPVCGMRIAIPGARHVFEHAGQRYYFCCPSCRRLFAANPEQHLTVTPTASGEGVSSDAISG